MGKIFITGSADGLGLLAAKALVGAGHDVIVHGRNGERGLDSLTQVPGAKGVVTGDLSRISEVLKVADEANKYGVFDAVIHNAGVYQVPANTLFAVNTIAPYLLTSLMAKPMRLIYLSSGMHFSGKANPENFNTDSKAISYSDTKLHVLMLAKSVARLWPDVYSNAVDPGWVPTKMGGKGAPDDLQKGYETQVWLATSNDKNAKVSGKYFFHQQERKSNPAADDNTLQEKFLEWCERITNVKLPR